MDASKEREAAPTKKRTEVERTSELEIVVTRTVNAPARLVWTNEEGDVGETVTTVTFDEAAGKTLLVVHDRFPSKEARDSGSADAMPEALDQLDELLASLGSTTDTD